MKRALLDAKILTPTGWRDDAALLIQGELIADICRPADIPVGYKRQALDGDYLLPGFIDTQVNGGGGVMLNGAESLDDIRKIAAAHRAFGTTGMLPTLISDDFAAMEKAADLIAAALAAGVPGILGLHFEGPYLNPDRKGIHPEAKIREMDAAFLALATRGDIGKVLVTLAPEAVRTDDIRALTAAGVQVAAGHSAATFDQMQAAINAGLTGVTHLYNAMPSLLSRDPGLIGAGLNAPDVFCGVINDTYHVHPATLKIALAAKGADRLMLVTDAMGIVGTAATEMPWNGGTIRLEGGRLTTADGTLAGSALDMASAVRNTVRHLDQPLETAVEMASASPARFLGLQNSHGHIAPGYRADLLRLAPDLSVRQSWIAGE